MVHFFEAFVDKEAGKLLATDAACTVSQDRLVLVILQIVANPLREFFSRFNLRPNRAAEMPDIILIVIAAIENDDIFILEFLIPFLRLQMRAG
ncbi:hypothetical protein D3C85_1154730 [compost metagenome]